MLLFMTAYARRLSSLQCNLDNELNALKCSCQKMELFDFHSHVNYPEMQTSLGR